MERVLELARRSAREGSLNPSYDEDCLNTVEDFIVNQLGED